jgi:type III pantothenate kinase
VLYVLNIGNTHTTLAEWIDGQISVVRKNPTGTFDFSAVPGGAPLAVSCVVPAELEKLTGRPGLFIVSSKVRLPFTFGELFPDTVGADRLADAAALVFSGPLPALCVDFGTAITFNYVDGAKVFRGGAIAPGRVLCGKALNSFTAKLPFIEPSASAPDSPGTDTAGAIRLGVDRGAVGLVREIISVFTEISMRESGQTPRLAATGGDADFFTKYIDGLESAGKDYTLRGIAQVWELNIPGQ